MVPPQHQKGYKNTNIKPLLAYFTQHKENGGKSLNHHKQYICVLVPVIFSAIMYYNWKGAYDQEYKKWVLIFEVKLELIRRKINAPQLISYVEIKNITTWVIIYIYGFQISYPGLNITSGYGGLSRHRKTISPLEYFQT